MRKTENAEHRPWGWFFTVYASPIAWVKILVVAPGRSLSLQRHSRRHEVWTTTDYGMQAVIGDETLDLVPGVGYDVPVGTQHRLINPTDHVCQVVEYAYGEPTEDDIERIEDDYGRAN